MSEIIKKEIYQNILQLPWMEMVDGQKKRVKIEFFGHNQGIKAVRDTVEGASRIRHTTSNSICIFNRNWNRPKHEVNAL